MQLSLMHESLNDALREAGQALGGTKKVGAMMWPEMPIDHASNKLRDCLNSERRERLNPDQVLMVMRLARQAGCHALAAYMMREAGYADPQPVEPEDEIAKMQREFIEATKHLGQLAARIESVQATASRLRVA